MKSEGDSGTKKQKKKMKFDQMSSEALSIVYDVAKFGQENDLNELFQEYSYEQEVKTKKKTDKYSIINSDHFFGILKELGLVKSLTPTI